MVAQVTPGLLHVCQHLVDQLVRNGLFQLQPSVRAKETAARLGFRVHQAGLHTGSQFALAGCGVGIDPRRAPIEFSGCQLRQYLDGFLRIHHPSIAGADFDSVVAAVAQRIRNLDRKGGVPITKAGLFQTVAVTVGHHARHDTPVDEQFHFDGFGRIVTPSPSAAFAILHGIDGTLQHVELFIGCAGASGTGPSIATGMIGAHAAAAKPRTDAAMIAEVRSAKTRKFAREWRSVAPLAAPGIDKPGLDTVNLVAGILQVGLGSLGLLAPSLAGALQGRCFPFATG